VEKINMAVKAEELNQGRDPKLFYKKTKEFFDAAKKSNKPFYLMCNSQDPHRPFYNSEEARNARQGKGFFDERGEPQPSRIFTEQEVTVPAFLPDIPKVRKEIAQYYNSVRRADDIVGEVMKALDESGMTENTVVFFLSDNGMSFPFSKTNVYLNSNRTPLMVRWPGITKPNQIEKDALVSGIDFLPTVLDILSVKDPDKLDGKSFKKLLTGQRFESEPYVYTLFFANSAFKAFPMRCIQNKDFAYIFSPWAYDGTLEFQTETKQGLTYKAMKQAANANDEIAKRLKLFDYRVPEEFYDLRKDPDALVNLANNPAYTNELNKFRKVMEQKMRETDDDILDAFLNKNDTQKLKDYITKTQIKTDAMRPYGIKGKAD
jgi:N-sulfoglucosamine sulfohydrolase